MIGSHRYCKALNTFSLAFVAMLICFCPKTFAYRFFQTTPGQTLHPVIAFGGGIGFSKAPGQSRTYPIIDPVTDEFFIYRVRNNTDNTLFFDLFFGAQWAYHPRWSLEFGLGYNQIDHFGVDGTLFQGVDVLSQNQFNYGYDIVSKQLLVEAKLLYNYTCRYFTCYHPYVLVGVGTSFNTTENFKTAVPPFLAFTRQYENKTQSSFSYAVGLGLDMDITDCTRLGLGYRFLDFGSSQLGPASIQSVPLSGTFSQSHLYTSEVLLQFTVLI